MHHHHSPLFCRQPTECPLELVTPFDAQLRAVGCGIRVHIRDKAEARLKVRGAFA